MGTELDLVGTVGTYRGTDAVNGATPDVDDGGNYWLVGFTSPFAINKSTKLIVGWSFAGGNGAWTQQGNMKKIPNPEAVNRGVVTASLAWTF
jgi:hypothetical protein